MGLSARDWLTIALFVASAVGAVLAWVLRRFITTIDKHEAAIYGDAGLFRLLALYVKREDHDVANAELAAQMEKMRLEAMQREGRIIDAISDQGSTSTEENRILRKDLSQLHERIDRLRDRNERRS
jgi:flagellar motility protein MotE (MotC chaperone)